MPHTPIRRARSPQCAPCSASSRDSTCPRSWSCNKADIAEPETIARLRSQVGDSVVVSARTGMGFEELRELIAERLPCPAVEVDLVVPYSRGDLISRVHTTGEVLAEEHLMEGTRLHARVDEALAAELNGLSAGA